jgi:hypothetical protein
MDTAVHAVADRAMGTDTVVAERAKNPQVDGKNEEVLQ